MAAAAAVVVLAVDSSAEAAVLRANGVPLGRHLVVAKLESMPIDSLDTWSTENPIPMTKRRQP